MYCQDLFQSEVSPSPRMATGSVALIYREPGTDLTVEVVGWKGKVSVRAYVPRNDRMHYLRYGAKLMLNFHYVCVSV